MATNSVRESSTEDMTRLRDGLNNLVNLIAQPAPWRDSTSPSSRSTSRARRTVGRDTAYRAQSCDSESSAPTSPNSPRAMRSRRSWAMVANRELVINL